MKITGPETITGSETRAGLIRDFESKIVSFSTELVRFLADEIRLAELVKSCHSVQLSRVRLNDENIVPPTKPDMLRLEKIAIAVAQIKHALSATTHKSHLKALVEPGLRDEEFEERLNLYLNAGYQTIIRAQ